MYEKLRKKLELNADEPEKESLQFGFKETANRIAGLLINNNTPDGFVIGIDGEWGSGKTTLLNSIEKQLKEKKPKLKVINFTAWEHERVDIFASLLKQINDKCDKKNKKLGKMVLSFGIDVLLRKTLSISKKEAENHFKELLNRRKTLRNDLNDIIKGKLIILIDDLDRCSMENTFVMLENIKFFLTIKKISVVIAVDMEKIDEMWGLKYNNKNAETIGRKYTEKMIKLRIPISYKSQENLENYIKKMVGCFDEKQLKFFADVLPSNPRKIKLALNQMYYVLNTANFSKINIKDKDNYLYTLMSWLSIINSNHKIARIIQFAPSYMVYSAFVCSKIKHRSKLEKALEKNKDKLEFRYENKLLINKEFLSFPILEILETVATSKIPLFKIFKQYGELFEIKKQPKTSIHVCKEYKVDLDRYFSLIDDISKVMPA